MTTMLKKTIYGAIFSLLAGFALGSVVYRQTEKAPSAPIDEVITEEKEKKDDTVSPPAAGGANGIDTGTLVLAPLPEPAPPELKVNAPDLSRTVTIPSSIPRDAGNAIKARIEELAATLKEKPDLGSAWLDLATYRKMINDFEGAREIWEFLTRLHPDSFIAYTNLASLYAFDLKDAVPAEKYFTFAYERGARDVSFFRSLYEFYRYVVKNDENAKKALSEGIERNPEAHDLKYLLENYEKQ